MQFFKFTRVGRMIPVTVLKRAGGRWKVVEAGMSSAGIVIRRARVLGNSGAPLSPSDRGPLDRAIRASEAAPADAIPSLNNHGQVILLAGSDRSICRLMQLPQASEEDTRRMVALRLETELPYPVAESLWACERAAGARGGRCIAGAQRRDLRDSPSNADGRDRRVREESRSHGAEPLCGAVGGGRAGRVRPGSRPPGGDGGPLPRRRPRERRRNSASRAPALCAQALLRRSAVRRTGR